MKFCPTLVWSVLVAFCYFFALHNASNVPSKRDDSVAANSELREAYKEVPCDESGSTKTFSFLIVGRNDFDDSNWRANKVMEALSYGIVQAGLDSMSEIVIVDWNTANSRAPYLSVIWPESEAMSNLTSPVRVLTVKPEIAQKYQGQSPLSEVHAINAVIRRLEHSTYIMRLDGDTLVSPEFFKFLKTDFSKVIKAAANDSDERARDRLLFYGSRRDCTKQATPLIDNNVVSFLEGSQILDLCTRYKGFYNFMLGPVGIMGVSRSLWQETGGYCEKMVGWGHMERELWNRFQKLKLDTAVVPFHFNEYLTKQNVSDIYPFYHIQHAKRARPNNYVGHVCKSEDQVSNGLQTEQLKLVCYASTKAKTEHKSQAVM